VLPPGLIPLKTKGVGEKKGAIASGLAARRYSQPRAATNLNRTGNPQLQRTRDHAWKQAPFRFRA